MQSLTQPRNERANVNCIPKRSMMLRQCYAVSCYAMLCGAMRHTGTLTALALQLGWLFSAPLWIINAKLKKQEKSVKDVIYVCMFVCTCRCCSKIERYGNNGTQLWQRSRGVDRQVATGGLPATGFKLNSLLSAWRRHIVADKAMTLMEAKIYINKIQIK